MRVRSVVSRQRRRVAAVAVGLVCAFAGVAVLTQSASQAATTVATFKVHGFYAWTVPSGVTKVTFTVYGASGGGAVDNNVLLAPGGAGGETKASFQVRPGMVFEISVGERGADSLGTALAPGGLNG